MLMNLDIKIGNNIIIIIEGHRCPLSPSVIKICIKWFANVYKSAIIII